MTTPKNIATLRRVAYRSQSRRVAGPWAVIRFAGGPLDGIRPSVTKRESVSWRIGFCTVTGTEPVCLREPREASWATADSDPRSHPAVWRTAALGAVWLTRRPDEKLMIRNAAVGAGWRRDKTVVAKA